MGDTHPDVIPMLAYRDGAAAMDWLATAFGFRERTRLLDGSGRLSHGEMEAGQGLIMLATPSPLYEGPAMHREHCAAAAAWSEVPYIIDGVLVYVEDVEAHFERSTAAGARILSQPEEDPRRYRVEDIEGHRWFFMERPGG